MSLPCSDQDYRTRYMKDARLPPGVEHLRCWCRHLCKSAPPLCMWHRWIDTEQPEWVLREIEERSRRAWESFYEDERREKAAEERRAAQEEQQCQLEELQRQREEQRRLREEEK